MRKGESAADLIFRRRNVRGKNFLTVDVFFEKVSFKNVRAVKQFRPPIIRRFELAREFFRFPI